MRVSLLFGMALLLLPARPAGAQVSGTIVIGGFPFGGIITIGGPHRVVVPARRVIVVERYPDARIVVVERWKPSRHWRHFDRDRYHRRVLWYDWRDGSYYDRARPGLRRAEVWERDGRYYRRDDDDRRRRDDRHRHRDR